MSSSWTYLIVDLASLAVPLVFSFHPKLRFDKVWRHYLPGIVLMTVIYIVWDVLFTQHGVWGFNPDYFIGAELLGLPIEEWLFFICIPYSCLFTYHCLERIAPHWKFSERLTKVISTILLGLWVILAGLHVDRLYSLVNFLWAIPVLLVALKCFPRMLGRFFLTYLILLPPFILVNGVLTGALYPEPVVWYDPSQFMGYRFFMPLEDYTYALSMLLVPLIYAQWSINRTHS